MAESNQEILVVQNTAVAQPETELSVALARMKEKHPILYRALFCIAVVLGFLGLGYAAYHGAWV